MFIVQGEIKTCNAPNITGIKSCVIETRIWSVMRDFTEIENEKYEKIMTYFSEGNFNFPLMHDIVVWGLVKVL